MLLKVDICIFFPWNWFIDFQGYVQHDSDSYNPVPGVMGGVPSSRNYDGGFSSKLMVSSCLWILISPSEGLIIFYILLHEILCLHAKALPVNSMG